MIRRTPVRKKRSNPRRGRLRDPKYLEWIRTQPCAIEAVDDLPLHMGPIEAAHVGLRGLSQKCSDLEAIPLCGWHHRLSRHSHHELGVKFWDHWKIDKQALIEHYNKLYEAENGIRD